MNWNSWSDFAAMGGYGVYVWGSFGMAAAVMLTEVWQLAARRRALARAPQRADRFTAKAPHEA